MRGIKFRFWDTKEGRWCGWDISGWVLVTNNKNIQEIQIAPKYEHIVTMQYTRLKDKNGREIYEGDILDLNGVVEFKDGSFVVNGWEPIGEMGVDKQTVIGNIYENPELLKGKV